METQYILDGTGLEQRLLLKQVTNRLKRKARRGKKKKKINTFVENLQLQGENLYLRNWEFTWQLPSVVKNCDNNTFCVTQDNSPQLNGYQANANQFFKLQKKAVRKLRRITKRNKIGKRFLKRGRKMIQKTKDLLNTIPATADSCQ